MKIKSKLKFALLLMTILVFIVSCKKDPITEVPVPLEKGKLKIEFSHAMGNDSLILNSNQYINEAGNNLEIVDLMYFISDVTLFIHDNSPKLITDITACHYVDLSKPTTLIWNILDSIPKGNVDSVSFIFGLNEQRNHSFAFVNPPESNMAWPDILGGGYHYMMMNGTWTDAQQIQQPFNFHMGIGQLYSDTITYNTNSITGYVQNYFKITLPTPMLTISANNTSILKIKMNILSWFTTPHIWDFNVMGGSVMQNQRALNIIKENGFDVFSVVQ
ncbi:MAG: MbnP family protein [Bacteroidota bacterium]